MSEYKRNTGRDEKGRLLLCGEEVYGNDQNTYNALSDLEQYEDIGSVEELAEFAELKKAKAEDRWIPVSTELPSNGMRVIVCLEGGFVCEAYRKGEIWDRYKQGSFEELMGEYVTHWRPLPTPPEEEGE